MESKFTGGLLGLICFVIFALIFINYSVFNYHIRSRHLRTLGNLHQGKMDRKAHLY